MLVIYDARLYSAESDSALITQLGVLNFANEIFCKTIFCLLNRVGSLKEIKNAKNILPLGKVTVCF